MNRFIELKPQALWSYFSEICKIPRISKHEEKIRTWLIKFALDNNLEHKEDQTGNILIVKNPSPGMEGRKTVILQSHLDMVGEKNSDHSHDWMNDPVIPIFGNEWVTADGTTLGADDGIGIAAQMAILTDATLKTGKVECLFTVDEESGMTGALNLQHGFFEGNILINLDSEDEGILYIGCAGGTDSIGTFKFQTTAIPKGYTTFEIAITGLTGGHSGDEIHKELANSIKLLSRHLTTIAESCNAMIATFNGGNLRNAIPRESFAIVAVPAKNESKLKLETETFLNLAKNEFSLTDPGLTVTISKKEFPGEVMIQADSRRLLDMLNACPHGVLAWSEEMKGLVETSTNLASVKFRSNSTIEVVTTQRSSKESGKKYASDLIEALMVPFGGTVTHSDGYPGWTPNLNSPILRATTETYKGLFNTNPEVMAIHAGLECGIFYEKFPGIDMISFGPTIKGAHTPEERINIESADKFWKLLTALLEKVPEKS